MSYILDALTKAAQQRDRQVPVVQRLLSPAPRARSLWTQASGRILLALGVNAVLLAGVLVWWLLPGSTQAPTQPIATPAPAPATPVRPLVKLEPLPGPVTTVEKPAAPAPDTRADVAAAPTQPSAASSPAAAAPAASASTPPAAPSTPPTAAPAGASAPSPPGPAKASTPQTAPTPRIGTPSIQPAPAQPAPAQPAPAMARSAPPPESASLRVEALIYADTPAERMVFINGRRYREGDSIDGRLRVEEIRENGVELSDQGRRFTLRVSR